MKCSRCHSLNAPNDTHCSGCHLSLAPQWKAAETAAAVAATPQWAYFFVALCGAIPLFTLGGMIPCALGFGSAGGCLQVARMRDVPSALRFVVCVGITVTAWLVLAVILVALFGSPKRL